MTLPTLELDPSFEISQSFSNPIVENNLGDGYKQISPLSFEPIVEWQVERTGLTTLEVSDLLQDLETYASRNGFLWQPNELEGLEVYTCDGWETTMISDDLWKVSAIFKKDLSGECFAFSQYINEAQIRSQLQGAKTFLQTYNRNTLPLLINSNGLLVNSFHDVQGRGGYFSSTLGTSEGQALMIKALCSTYQVLGDSYFLNLAITMANAFVTYFFNTPVPTNPNNLWVPHWLVNVKASFPTKGRNASDPLNSGHFDVVVNFTNGVGQITTGGTTLGERLSNVYKVYSTDSTILWRNVYTPLVSGIEYEIDYWVSNFQLQGQNYRTYPDTQTSGGRNPTTTSEIAGKIVLKNTSFTGQLKLIYSTWNNNENIAIGEKTEAYPLWRKLQPTEFNGAFDSLFWAYEAFKRLHSITADTKWLQAREAIKQNAITTAVVQNITYWYKKDDSPEPFSYPGSQVILVNNANGYTAARETVANKLNWLRVNVNAAPLVSVPSCEVQNFAVQTGLQNNSTVVVEYAHSQACLMKVVLSTTPDAFDLTQLFEANMLASGSGTPQTKMFSPQDFIRWGNNRTVWYPTVAETPIYTYSGNGGTSTAIREEVDISGAKPVVYKIDINKSTNGFAGAGFVLISNLISNPPRIRYSLSGASVILRIKDGSDIFWDRVLTSTGWASTKFEWGNFTYSSINTNPQGSITPNNENPIQSIEFISISNATSTIRVWYLTNGLEAETIETPIVVYKASVVDIVKTSHQFWIGNFRPTNSSFDTLNYNPGVVPFTVNLLNGAIDAWRGIPMSGYQDPAFWRKVGLEERVEQSLEFLSDAQTAYQTQNVNGTDGLFSPAYSWAYWDSGDYLANGINKFGWNAPDPNSRWFPYQVRAVVSTAEAWYLDKSDIQAKTITMRFLKFIDRNYLTRKTNIPLTDAPPIVDPQSNYSEPHVAALIMRASMYANLAGGDRGITFRLIKRSLDFINTQYVTTGSMAGSWSAGQPIFQTNFREWFGFWQAEIMESLCLVLQYKTQIRYPGCSTTL